MSYSGLSRRSGPGLGTWALLAGVALLVGLGLALYFSLPRLDSAVPPSGAQFVSSRSPLRLTFNRPMDRASVEAGLHLSPARAGAYAWQGQTLTFTPADAWPISSTVTVTLSGARSERGLPLLGDVSWTFSVAERRLAYLVDTADPNLWISPIAGPDAGSQPQQLTTEPVGVYDYAVSPDGTHIAYAARRSDGGDDLKVAAVDGSGISTLVLCPNQACLSPVYSPDGTRLAYERHTLVAGLNGQPSPGPSQVYVRDLASGREQVVGDGDTRFPRWGPDTCPNCGAGAGGRLAFLDTDRQAVVVQDLASGAVTYVPDSSGSMGTWSPDGAYIVYPEIVVPPSPTAQPTPADTTASNGEDDNTSSNAFYSYLLRVNIATNETVNLSGQGVLEDASPVYSPAGDWLAFGRSMQQNNQWTPGRQLWLMRPDGTGAHALTGDPLYNQSAFTWSPDGALLAYMRFNTNDPGAPAEIWLIGVGATGNAVGDGSTAVTGNALTPGGARKLVQGYLPEWLP
jgi:dipeptidyl aminopeptidase/acylaminoacyl peptidase